MKRPSLNSGGRMLAALAVSSGALTIGSLALTTSAAHADPGYSPTANPFVGVGSNTIEDLFDAYSGAAPTPGLSAGTNYYAPLHDPTTKEGVYSWDAVNPSTLAADCISPKPGAPGMARPNGSGNGIIAISDEIDGSAWSAQSNTACAAVKIGGEIDFARSSSAPPSTSCATPLSGSNCLAYVDFAHDAVSYAYYGPGVATSAEDQLSTTTLHNIYSSATGTFAVGGTTYYACLPQFGSGTEKFFEGAIGVSLTTAEAAANASGCVGFEENGANTFEAAAAASGNTGDVAVTPFSVGSFISQENGAAQNRSSAGVAAGVDLGYADGTGSQTQPYVGTISGSPPQDLSPNATFYANTTYGRDLYVVVDNKKLNGSFLAVNSAERRIFGFLGTNFATSGGPQSNATTGSGAICATTGAAAVKVGTAPGATYVGDAQDYLKLFGFTPSSINACGTEYIVPVTTATTGS